MPTEGVSLADAPLMGLKRHPGRLLAALAVALSVVITSPSSPALSAEPTFTPVKRYDVTRKLVFPVIGITKYWSGFGDCRENCTREHHGVDILSYEWKGLPVVAAHDGVIVDVTYDVGNAGCSVRIRSKDRWETRYFHLNSDLPGTDTVGHPCPAPGIEVGATVVAGQLIGWLGDSGNAEHTSPHLHFELRNRSGYPIDPYRSLRAARRITYEWLPSDASASTILLSQESRSTNVPVVFMVSSTDIGAFERSEQSATILSEPLIAFDPNSPLPAIEEAIRLNPDRIIVFSDTPASSVVGPLSNHVGIVETAPVPVPEHGSRVLLPDGEEAGDAMLNPIDGFATFIVGATDRIWRYYQDEYAAFTVEHRSIVLKSTDRAARYLGQRSSTMPPRDVDTSLLWWTTGDGWIGTEPTEAPPGRGYAYLTERRANPWTLAFLASLSEAPRTPVWREN